MPKLPPVQYQHVVLRGGLDQITPTLSLPPGVCKDALNFECSITGGYSRIAGYERYNGKSQPSSATYMIVQFATFVNTPSVGNTITSSSGGSGYVIAVTSSYIVVTKVTGTIVVGDTITVGATTIGTMIMQSTTVSALTDAQYLNEAADVYRADISPIAGSGEIRGIFLYNDVVYAFRDNAGGTAVNMWKTTGSGWTQITFYNEVSFTLGNGAEPADGTTLTQGGVTATIKRTCTQSGAWGGTAAGRFIVTNPTLSLIHI